MNKRILGIILAVVMLMSMAITAVAEPNTDLSGEISIWVWGDYEEKGAMDFNEYYPNIKVNYVFVPQDEYPSKVQSAIVSGLELPDVVLLEMTPRAMFLSYDAWEKLDAEPYNFNKDEYAAFGLPLISNENGDVCCVQIDNCVGGYVYNRELAKKYFGTDVPEELEAQLPTLDALIEAADKLDGDYMYAGVDDAFMVSFGLYTEEPLVKDSKLNLDAYYEAYKFCAALVEKNAVNMYMQWTPAWNSAFSQNNILFWPGPSWYIAFTLKANDPNADAKYGLMTPPGGGYSWGGTAYAIPKDNTPEQKELAWTWIKWFTMSDEGNACFVREQSTPTLYLPSYETDMYKNDGDPYFAGQDIVSKLLEIAQNPNTNVRPMTKYDQMISEVNNQVLRDIEQGMNAEDAYAKLKTGCLEVLAQYGITE